MRFRSSSWLAQWARRGALGVWVVVLTACGGGGGGGNASPPTMPAPSVPQVPAEVPAPSSTQVILQSESGDPIGLGRGYSYSQANAIITATVRDRTITIIVKGDEDWQGDFRLPGTGDLAPGRYQNVGSVFSSASTAAALRWFGVGRGCRQATGWFEIDRVRLDLGGAIQSLVLRFERYCDAASAPLRGEVRWLQSDPTRPPGPLLPAPAGLWQPASGSLPATGNYVHLSSEAGDIVGLGLNRTFTGGNARLVTLASNDIVRISAEGDGRSLHGIIQAPLLNLLKIQPGYYSDMTSYPFYNPTRGGMSWVVDGRGCADARGWMDVRSVDYDETGVLVAIEYRFEQRCLGSIGALRGAVRWSRAVAEAPPVATAPTDPVAWRPAQGAVPAQGNVFYVESDAGEFIGGGVASTLTPRNAVFTVRERAGQVQLEVSSQWNWGLLLRAEGGFSAPRVGVYQALESGYGDGDPAPHFSLAGSGKACGTSVAWLAIDEVEYVDNQLQALSIRFEHRCDGAVGAVRGQFRWRADDPTLPAPPAAVPENFWQPQPTAIPADISYVALDSQRSDFVGDGLKTTYTQANARITLVAIENRLELLVQGEERWSATLQGPSGYPRLTTGFYTGLQRYPFHDRSRGGLAWSGEGRGCNEVTGSFVIDAISYGAQGQLESADFRLEQRCVEGFPGASWVGVRWRASDNTEPPGPGAAPAGLWTPPPGAVPALGNVLFFESSADDFIGQGATRLITASEASFSIEVVAGSNEVRAEIALTGSSSTWSAAFQPMFNLPRLERGYYFPVKRTVSSNSARGGLTFSGDGRGCNDSVGWLMVDEVTYINDTIVSLAVRFEQSCEGLGSLRGVIRWTR